MHDKQTTFKPGDLVTFVVTEGGKRLPGRVVRLTKDGDPIINTPVSLRQGEFPRDIQPVSLPPAVEPKKGLFLYFGSGSSSQAVHELRKRDPEKYSKLRAIAIEQGIIPK
jgi:hypothetical protein